MSDEVKDFRDQKQHKLSVLQLLYWYYGAKTSRHLITTVILWSNARAILLLTTAEVFWSKSHCFGGPLRSRLGALPFVGFGLQWKECKPCDEAETIFSLKFWWWFETCFAWWFYGFLWVGWKFYGRFGGVLGVVSFSLGQTESRIPWVWGSGFWPQKESCPTWTRGPLFPLNHLPELTRSYQADGIPKDIPSP